MKNFLNYEKIFLILIIGQSYSNPLEKTKKFLEMKKKILKTLNFLRNLILIKDLKIKIFHLKTLLLKKGIYLFF